jgi:hypothetical protein
MRLKHLYTATLAATLLVGATALACAQASPPPDPSNAATGKGNSAWTNPEIEAEPPTPNGGFSSGAHSGNESPTTKGISKNDENLSEESKKNQERATTGKQ